MRDSEELAPQEKGSRVPPVRKPPTAIGAGTPDPDGEPRRHAVARQGELAALIATARQVLVPVFEAADVLADRIISAVRDAAAGTTGRS